MPIDFIATKFRLAAFSLLILTLIYTSYAPAQDLVEWHSGNIQLLRGKHYKVGDAERSIITVEYANQWAYGDTFIFVDASRYDDGVKTAYGEISPRFSLSKMFDTDLSNNLVKDVLLSFTLEKGEDDVRAYLYGIGMDLNLPGFRYFKSNLYLRHNPRLEEDTWQITLAWQYPFQISQTRFKTEGFADLAGNAAPAYHSNQFIVPRLLADLGPLFDTGHNTLWFGIEYSYWNNKYGIRGVKESTPQLQLIWNF